VQRLSAGRILETPPNALQRLAVTSTGGAGCLRDRRRDLQPILVRKTLYAPPSGRRSEAVEWAADTASSGTVQDMSIDHDRRADVQADRVPAFRTAGPAAARKPRPAQIPLLRLGMTTKRARTSAASLLFSVSLCQRSGGFDVPSPHPALSRWERVRTKNTSYLCASFSPDPEPLTPGAQDQAR
jgi:hypothetical protein